MPELHDDPLDDCYDEMEILGFPFRNPMELCEQDLFKHQLAKDLYPSLANR